MAAPAGAAGLAFRRGLRPPRELRVILLLIFSCAVVRAFAAR